MRQRQLNALYYSIQPTKYYTDERARAVFEHLLRRYILARKLAARENEDNGESYHERQQRQENEKQLQAKLRAIMSPQVKARLKMHQRVEAEATADYTKLRKRLGDMPEDMKGKTFAELEIIIFGDASDEAHTLDAQAAQFELNEQQV